jgi:D-alanine-D-alanine ligase-like ATP-grasp enzyme
VPRHVIFVAPFFLEATLRFLRGACRLNDVALSLISQDPLDKVPADIRQHLAGHWRVDDALDPAKLVTAARHLGTRLGAPERMFGPLEQLQVPIAVARAELGIDGLSVAAARNFRDKARMKSVLREAGVPCARHGLATNVGDALEFARAAGFPLIVKPPAGAGGKSTWRVDSEADLERLLGRAVPSPGNPTLLEEFVQGTEYSFDSVMIGGKMVWHSISCYLPAPLVVLENPWIQWSVYLPRRIDGEEFDPIRSAAAAGLEALGLETGLSHMEWFRLADGRIAVSEVGARPPGAQITSLLSYAHDIDFYRAWPRILVDRQFEPPPRRYAAGAVYFRGQGQGTVRAIHGLDEAQHRFGSLVVEVKLPREGQPPSDSYEGDGYAIVRHEDSGVVHNALAEIARIVRVELA